MANSILQAERVCYITGQTGALHKHHIFGGIGRRSLSEKYGLWVWLAPEWHNMSALGVHFNRALDLELKQAAQRAFERGHSRAEWMSIMRRNYLDE